MARFPPILLTLALVAQPALAQNEPGGSSPSEAGIGVAETPDQRYARQLQATEVQNLHRLERFRTELAESRAEHRAQLEDLHAEIAAVRAEREQLPALAAPTRERLLRRLEGVFEEQLEIIDRIAAAESEIIEELQTLITLAGFFRANLDLATSRSWSPPELDAFITQLTRRILEAEVHERQVEADRWTHVLATGRTLDRYRQAEAEMSAVEAQRGLGRAERDAAWSSGQAVGRYVRDLGQARATDLANRLSARRAETLASARRQFGSWRGQLALAPGLSPGGFADPLELLARAAAFLAPRRTDSPAARALSAAQRRVRQAVLLTAYRRVIADPEGDLARLQLRIDRARLASLELERELSRVQLTRLTLVLDEIALRLPFMRLSRNKLAEQRDAMVAAEAGDLRRRSTSWLDPRYFSMFASHTELVLTDPARALRSDLPATPLTPSAALLVLLAIGLGALPRLYRRGTRRSVEGSAPDGPSLRAGIYRWLPVTSGLLTLFALEVVPYRFQTVVLFGAALPLFLATAKGFAGGIERAAREESVAPATARYLGAVIRLVASLLAVLALALVVFRALGYSRESVLPVWSLMLITSTLGTLAFLIPWRSALALLKLSSDDERPRVLRRLLALCLPLLLVSLVFSAVTFLLGYRNLAVFVFRRVFLVLTIVMLFPSLHARGHAAVRRLLGLLGVATPSNDSGLAGRLYRAVAPIVSVAIVTAAIAVLVFAWGPEAGWRGIIGAFKAPLFRFGESEISVLSLEVFVLVIVLTVAVSRWARRSLMEHVYPLYHLTEGTRAAMDMLLRYTIFVLGFLVGLDVIGLPLGALAIFASVLGIGIGFGSQTLVGNFMAGLILQFSKPISVGDIVEVEGVVGRIQRISGAATVIRTYENLSVVVPNATFISSTVVNWTESGRVRRLSIPVGVAYGSDLSRVKRVLLRCAEDAEEVLASPEPSVQFDDFGESSLDLNLLVWIADADRLRAIATRLRYRIDAAFREAGIEIPFPQRDLHVRGVVDARAVAADKGWEVVEEPPGEGEG